MAVYVSDQYPFSIQYPADWPEGLLEDVTAIFLAASGENFAVVEEDLISAGPGELSLKEFVDLSLLRLSLSLEGFELLSRQEATTPEGLTVEIVKYTWLGGTISQVLMAYVHENTVSFIALYTILTSGLEEMQEMIDYSFSTFQVHTEESFLLKWGELGADDGQFGFPSGIAVDSSGNVFVAGNNRVQVFDSNGVFLSKWGSFGVDDGKFINLGGIGETVGSLFVADSGNHRVQQFGGDGTHFLTWGTFGEGDGEFSHPQDVAAGGELGNIYVLDTGNNRVQRFEPLREFVSKWGELGDGDGQFNEPLGIALDVSGNVYVADTGNHRVQVFSSTGEFLTKWGSEGSSEGQFSSPRGIAVDASGKVYVADTGNHRVQVFSSDGEFLGKLGSHGSFDGQFKSPSDVAVDGSGNIYVADSRNSRVQVFSGL